MKLLVIFASAMLYAQAIQVPYTLYSSSSSESSEEEYRIYLPNEKQRSLNWPGVGQIHQPIVKAVKFKVPRYAPPEVKKYHINHALSARGLTLQDFAPKDVRNAVQQPGWAGHGQGPLVPGWAGHGQGPSVPGWSRAPAISVTAATTPAPTVGGLLEVTSKPFGYSSHWFNKFK